MPYGQDTIKLVVGGTIDSVQTWSTTLSFTAQLTGGSWGPANLLSLLQALATGPFTTWWTSMKPLAGTTTNWQTLTGYFYPAGSSTSAFLAEYPLAAPLPGTGSGQTPRFVAIVASFRTDISGRSGRGRSYFPCTSAAVAANGQYTSAICTQVAGAYATLITSVNGMNVSAYNLTGLTGVVASLTKSQNNDIKNVICDSVPDTQHRREDKLNPAFVITATV